MQDFNSLTLSSEKASKAIPLARASHNAEVKTIINGVDAIKANDGETLSAIASRAGLDVSTFIQYNDLSIDHTIRPGSFYFVEQKKKKNSSGSYYTKIGDDLWSISQQFGVRLKSLKKLNPGITEGFLVNGSVIALISLKNTPPQDVLVESEDIAELSDDTFSWGTQPHSAAFSTPKLELPQTLKMDTVDQEHQLIIQSGPDSLIQHEVLPGETLYSIANKYTVSVSDLINDNQLNVATPLKKGQLIAVHKSSQAIADAGDLGGSNQPEMFTYEVKGSDTLYGIARQFGATIKEIMDWNNKSVLTVTRGEKLKILKR
jgi:membrane-bound lytic murein transglycosylase D